jgi:hypothetical protein
MRKICTGILICLTASLGVLILVGVTSEFVEILVGAWPILAIGILLLAVLDSLLPKGGGLS